MTEYRTHSHHLMKFTDSILPHTLLPESALCRKYLLPPCCQFKLLPSDFCLCHTEWTTDRYRVCFPPQAVELLNYTGRQQKPMCLAQKQLCPPAKREAEQMRLTLQSTLAYDCSRRAALRLYAAKRKKKTSFILHA